MPSKLKTAFCVAFCFLWVARVANIAVSWSCTSTSQENSISLLQLRAICFPVGLGFSDGRFGPPMSPLPLGHGPPRTCLCHDSDASTPLSRISVCSGCVHSKRCRNKRFSCCCEPDSRHRQRRGAVHSACAPTRFVRNVCSGTLERAHAVNLAISTLFVEHRATGAKRCWGTNHGVAPVGPGRFAPCTRNCSQEPAQDEWFDKLHHILTKTINPRTITPTLRTPCGKKVKP